MSLVALDGSPLVIVGALREGTIITPGTANTTQDAANEACIMIGQLLWADGGTHTVDTSGSSSLGWRCGARTLANATTVFKVGLATVDTSVGPPGRAVNVADVITFDVSRSHSTVATIVTNAWNESVPTSGTKTISHGDVIAFCTQMTVRGGTDSVLTTCGSAVSSSFPFVTNFIGAVYSVATSAVPNAVVTASDGTQGVFAGGPVISVTANTQTWNNTSTPKEYGNLFQLPFPMKIYGMISSTTATGNFDHVLYSDPLGTPVAEKTYSFDLHVMASTGVNQKNIIGMFPLPYSAAADQSLGAIINPTSASDITASYLTVNASSHLDSYAGGSDCYAINRTAGAFAAQNAGKDRFSVGLLVGAFEYGGAQSQYDAQPIYQAGI